MPSQTPTTEAPKAQQPMQLESQNNSLVTAQPVCPGPPLESSQVKSSHGTSTDLFIHPQTSEPRPNANEPQLSLRGGGLNCGFDCCGGACRFHKSCC
jgi:hypothetical protein